MTITTLPATFADQTLDIIIIGNERWIRGPQIGAPLGYGYFPEKAVRKLYQRHAAEFDTSDTMVVELPSSGGMQLTRLFSHKGVAKLAMLAQTPRAAEFRDWAARTLTAPAQTPRPPVAALPRPPAPPLSRSSRSRLMSALRQRYPLLERMRGWWWRCLTDKEVQLLTREAYSLRQLRDLRTLLIELGELPSPEQRRHDAHAQLRLPAPEAVAHG